MPFPSISHMFRCHQVIFHVQIRQNALKCKLMRWADTGLELWTFRATIGCLTHLTTGTVSISAISNFVCISFIHFETQSIIIGQL